MKCGLATAFARVKGSEVDFYKGTGEYYLDLSEILFFETEGSKIYAHTQKEAYEVPPQAL